MWERWTNHVSSAKRPDKAWGNTYIYRAIRKYGIDKFRIRTIDTASTEDRANEFEKFYIKLFDTHQKARGYNLTLGGDGVVPNDETRKKIGSGMRGKTHTPEVRAIISKAHTGRKHRPESLAKMSAARAGIKLSEAHRKKLSDAKQGVYVGENHPMFGKHHTEESKKKISEANRETPSWNAGLKYSGQRCAQMSAAQIKRNQDDPSLRDRVRASVKALWANPEYRAMQMASRKAAQCRI